jgi:diguanylate cyclase (GGDEF)-like protein
MEKILIVDDHPGNIRVVAAMLQPQYTVLAANNGVRAIKIAEDTHPDLILLDVMMPEMDGFAVCEALKKNPSTKDIPIIFITAKTEIDDVVRGFSIGGCDYISKPFNPEELFVRVNTHIELKKSKELLQKYISELELKNRELDRMSKTDHLTELANRRFMTSRLKEEAERGKRTGEKFSILMCDIDNFKKINDTYGHEIGDLAIKEVSNAIKNVVREYDVVSRWGGEEFLILLINTSSIEAEKAAEKIREAIEHNKIAIDKGSFKLTISIGVSEYLNEVSISENVNNADKALYESKNNGKNKVTVYIK